MLVMPEVQASRVSGPTPWELLVINVVLLALATLAVLVWKVIEVTAEEAVAMNAQERYGLELDVLGCIDYPDDFWLCDVTVKHEDGHLEGLGIMESQQGADGEERLWCSVMGNDKRTTFCSNELPPFAGRTYWIPREAF